MVNLRSSAMTGKKSDGYDMLALCIYTIRSYLPGPRGLRFRPQKMPNPSTRRVGQTQLLLRLHRDVVLFILRLATTYDDPGLPDLSGFGTLKKVVVFGHNEVNQG